MKLNEQIILDILSGELIPPPSDIESINNKMWKYYRKLKWATTGTFMSREFCGGLSLKVPYKYLSVRQSNETFGRLTVILCPEYGGNSNALLKLDHIPAFVKNLIRIYMNAGWCDAVDIPRIGLPRDGDMVLGAGNADRHIPRDGDVVVGRWSGERSNF